MKIVVVGLGYVGLPLAVQLAKHFKTIGFDIDTSRVAELGQGFDRTREVDEHDLAASALDITCDPSMCVGSDVYIVTVPTPIDEKNQPDLRPLIGATKSVAKMLDVGRQPIVVYESTVYPGVTEDVCAPLLASESGLTRSKDFFVGYSPERINPGDRVHTVDRITKVVAGENAEVTNMLMDIYGRVTSAGTFAATSIKVAEAAKVIENAQRDINIAFMNEITQIFDKVGISIWDVLDAAGTKWNFLPFQPGLVGGHCIGVDPYYLSYRAEELGHHPQVILAGRETNDGMSHWIAEKVHESRDSLPSRVLILGVTFKENVPDLRNSKVVDVIRRLEEFGHDITIHDPLANPVDAHHEYGLTLSPHALDGQYDVVLCAVPHAQYCELNEVTLARLVVPAGVVFDLKRAWPQLDATAQPYTLITL
jgi:UDP-N-acetyl-D-galactosamine dehydrogenase